MNRDRDLDEDSNGDPADMLALLERQQDSMTRQLAAFVPWILLAWGIAWFVGFGLLWLIDGAKPGYSVPLPVAVVVFIALMAGALVASGVLGARSQRGIRSTPQAGFTGSVFGVTWVVGFVSLMVFGSALIANGMPRELANIFYPTGSVLFVGIMYMIAGAIWQARPALWMGGWIVVVALVAPYFGYPTHYLVFALAGGGVFLVGALVVGLWVRR
ncbi:hypothetical protein [Microbacterium flavescens]|uniref:hypothetical protein n=1 Tax=Microbacterium flavescens TaxID=69366 RepID=UPI001BDE7E5B|nr:hypothetical protein [Microbacterium flavescens]BFF12123.1 hypothetical protein GCM10025699_34260 [Microbacterium flavescens]